MNSTPVSSRPKIVVVWLVLLACAALLLGVIIAFAFMGEKKEALQETKVFLSAKNLGPGNTDELLARTAERHFSRLPEVKKTSSVSRAGFCELSVFTETGADLSGQLFSSSTFMQNLKRDLPQDARISHAPGPAAFAPVQYVLEGDLSMAELTGLATRLSDTLLVLPKVADVQLDGAMKTVCRITTDPNKLKVAHLTPQEVYRGIHIPNLGRIRGGPAVEDLRSVPLTTTTGQTLQLSDVAMIEVALDETVPQFSINGKKAIQIRVFSTQAATLQEMTDSVQRRIQSFSKQLPAGVSLQPVFIQQAGSPFTGKKPIGLLSAFVLIAIAFVLLLRATKVRQFIAATLVLAAAASCWFATTAPPGTAGEFLLRYDMAAGTSFKDAALVHQRVGELLRAENAIAVLTQRTVNAPAPGGECFVRLRENEIRADVIQRLRNKIMLPDVRTGFVKIDSRHGPEAPPVKITVSGAEWTNVLQTAGRANALLKQVPALTDLHLTGNEWMPRLNVQPDIMKAPPSTFTGNGLEMQLAMMQGGYDTGIRLDDFSNEIPVILQYANNEAFLPQESKVFLPDGSCVPLETVATISNVSEPAALLRENGAPVIYITAQTEEPATLVQSEIQRQLAQLTPDPDVQVRLEAPQLKARFPDLSKAAMFLLAALALAIAATALLKK